MIEALIVIGGGMGTRMAAYMPGVPKLMLPLHNNETVLSNLICQIRPRALFLALGSDHESVRLPENAKELDIRLSIEDAPLGTFGALKKLVDKYQEDLPNMLVVTLGDLVCSDFDRYQRLQLVEAINSLENCFFYSKNNHPGDSDRVAISESGRIESLLRKDERNDAGFFNKTLSGLYVLTKREIIDSKIVRGDIIHDYLPSLLKSGHVRCRQLTGTLSDVGTPDRYRKIVESKRYRRERKYVFLDLDGTVIENRGSSAGARNIEMTIKKRLIDYLKVAQDQGHKLLVVTNQGDIAKGFKTEADLQNDFARLEEALWHHGVWIDDFFYCPHHPDKGFSGEVRELKISCGCRKPNVGMFDEARKKWACDVSNSIMIGDSEADRLFARNIGIGFLHVDLLAAGGNEAAKFVVWATQ